MALRVQLVVLESAFMMASTVWSVFAILVMMSPVPSHFKSAWGYVPNGVSATRHIGPIQGPKLPEIG